VTIDIAEVLRTLGTTGIIVAALAWVSKALLDHLLAKELSNSSLRLKAESDRQLEDLKAELKLHGDQEIEAVKSRATNALEAAKLDFNKALAAYQSQLETESARRERITQEIVRWANPIHDSVIGLLARLDNILSDGGYLALSEETERDIAQGWSITYRYFMPSTLFLFAQYFCWVRLLHERMSLELFGSNETATTFFDKAWAVGRTLSNFPMADAAPGQDMQVFSLQHRGVGEALIIREDGVMRCMRYAEFLQK
jgi:hypothetical protein